MTWIEVVAPGPDQPNLATALGEGMRDYPPEYGPPGPSEHRRLPQKVRDDSVVLAHSLIPKALQHVFAGYGALLDPALPLTRRQHEMIATTVSALNRCFY